MKHADFWEKQMKKNLFNTCSKLCARCITVVPLSFSSLLDDFCFVFFGFITLAIKIKNPEIPAVEVGKKMRISLHYLGNMYLHTMKCNRPGYLQHV
jgi:hypothetical protein